MSGIRLDFGAAHDAAARLAVAQAAIADRLSTLEAEAATLSGGWAGDAQVAYATAQAEWSGSMTRMSSILDAARQTLDEWVSEFEQLESELSTGWPG